MHWYYRRYKDSPAFARAELQGKISRLGVEWFNNLPDRKKLSKQIGEWDLARGQSWFHPNESAFDFFISLAMVKFISGGNRSGKTQTCTMDVLMQCEGWHPLQRRNLEKLWKGGLSEQWFINPITRKVYKVDVSYLREHFEYVLDNKLWLRDPPIAARCVAVDFPNGVEKFCGPEYVQWATRSELKYIGFDNEKKRRNMWKNKSFVEFMTTDQELDAHGGAARDVIQFDEEPPSTYWQENMMRILSTKGRMILGMTAVKGITWPKMEIWDKFEETVREGIAA